MGLLDWTVTQLPGLSIGSACVVAAWFAKTLLAHRKDAREERKDARAAEAHAIEAHEAHARAWKGACDGLEREKESIARQLKIAEAEKGAVRQQLQEITEKGVTIEAIRARVFAVFEAIRVAVDTMEQLQAGMERRKEKILKSFCEAFDLSDRALREYAHGNFDPESEEQYRMGMAAVFLEQALLTVEGTHLRSMNHFGPTIRIVNAALLHPRATADEFMTVAWPILEEARRRDPDNPVE